MNNELKKLSSWFQANKLSINIKKSHFILFNTKQNRQKLDLHFSINDRYWNSDCVNEVLFLGVILDEHLFWKSQIQNVARKVSKSVGIIYKSSFCLNKTSLCTLYYSLVYPYLHYCASVWGSTYQSPNLKRFINLQERAIRIVSRSSFEAHANTIFVSLWIPKFEDIIKFQIGKVMYVYKTAFFLTMSMRCFYLTVTYIHIINITLEVRIPSVCPTAGQM